MRGDLLQLYRNYQQAVSKGDIEREDGISGRQMKEFICNTCDDLLPGIAMYNGEARNVNLKVEQLLKYCDLVCAVQIKSLKRKRDNGVTPVASMYVDSSKRSRYENGYGKGKEKEKEKEKGKE